MLGSIEPALPCECLSPGRFVCVYIACVFAILNYGFVYTTDARFCSVGVPPLGAPWVIARDLWFPLCTEAG